jgi:hypothetical protein
VASLLSDVTKGKDEVIIRTTPEHFKEIAKAIANNDAVKVILYCKALLILIGEVNDKAAPGHHRQIRDIVDSGIKHFKKGEME